MAKHKSKHKSKRLHSTGTRKSTGQARQQSNRWPRIGLSILGTLLFLMVLYGINAMGQFDSEADHTEPQAINRTIGGVTNCQRYPEFSEALDFESIAIDTSRSRGDGLVLFDMATHNIHDKRNTYQHETWDDAGGIGSYTIDGNGNIYIAPFPYVDLFENRPEAQNTIHRVDTMSSVMTTFIKLPAAGLPSTQSPFGVVGLTYDCETDSLYAASLAGTTRLEELGRIYQIDLVTGEIIAQLEGVDAYALGIFNGADGKRLYFGRGRSSAVYSIALDEKGTFSQQPRQELSLVDFYNIDRLVARRITFRNMRMKVDAFKFRYNLMPMAEQGPRPSFRFIYNESSDTWQFVEMVRDDL